MYVSYLHVYIHRMDLSISSGFVDSLWKHVAITWETNTCSIIAYLDGSMASTLNLTANDCVDVADDAVIKLGDSSMAGEWDMFN